MDSASTRSINGTCPNRDHDDHQIQLLCTMPDCSLPRFACFRCAKDKHDHFRDMICIGDLQSNILDFKTWPKIQIPPCVNGEMLAFLTKPQSFDEVLLQKIKGIEKKWDDLRDEINVIIQKFKQEMIEEVKTAYNTMAEVKKDIIVDFSIQQVQNIISEHMTGIYDSKTATKSLCEIFKQKPSSDHIAKISGNDGRYISRLVNSAELDKWFEAKLNEFKSKFDFVEQFKPNDLVWRMNNTKICNIPLTGDQFYTTRLRIPFTTTFKMRHEKQPEGEKPNILSNYWIGVSDDITNATKGYNLFYAHIGRFSLHYWSIEDDQTRFEEKCRLSNNDEVTWSVDEKWILSLTVNKEKLWSKRLPKSIDSLFGYCQSKVPETTFEIL